jgi:hypothetical protein
MRAAIHRGFLHAFTAATTIAVFAAPLFAQESPNAPRQPAVRHFPPAWVGYFVMFVIVGLIVAISLYPSKRGHQE